MNRTKLIAAMLLSSPFILTESHADWDGTNFSADGRKWQPAPAGYGIPGKDNGRGIGTHNAGEDCGICHKPGGKASNSIFGMAGTLYVDRAGRKPLKGGEVILQDFNGKVISMTSNAVGNFWTYEPIGANPYTVIGKAAGVALYSYDAQKNLVPADPKWPQTWQYKAWIRNGDRVRPMVTIAPVGGATITNNIPDINSRMMCAMHHGPTGSYGPLFVSDRSTLSSYPASGISFKKHVLPTLRSKCAPCHVPNVTTTRIITKTDLDTPRNTVVDYSGNLDLTTYGAADGTNGKKKGIKSVVNTSSPDTSKLFNATAKDYPHAGGWTWSTADAEYKAIRQWIAEGAQNN